MQHKWISTENRGIKGYLFAVGVSVIAALIRATLLQAIGMGTAYLTFYPAVVVAALYGGLRSGALATIVSSFLSLYWTELSGPMIWGFSNSTLLLIAVFFFNGMMIAAMGEGIHRGLVREQANLEHISAMNEELRLMNSEQEQLNKKLAGMNEELERRVAERTRELQAANHRITVQLNQLRRSEAELKESEMKYSSALKQSSDAIAIIDIQSKEILEVNQRWMELLGYSESEAFSLTAYDIVDDTREKIDESYSDLLQEKRLSHQMVKLKRKDGSIIEMERAGTVITYSGKQTFMMVDHDISSERKLQALISKDVSLAANVQKSLVPGDFVDTLVSVKTIYKPYRLVSGDFFDYFWNKEYKRFAGFVLDISGHGVTSSLQGIAVSTYFRDVLQSQMNLPAKLHWINQRVMKYFTDDTFAAAICFEIDFKQQRLNYVTAGVYGFLAHSAALPVVVKKAGSLIGISESPEYTEWSVPIRAGDAFYFMSDGIFEQVELEQCIPVGEFDRTVELLRSLSEKEERKDDCSAICIQIGGTPSFPIRFDFYRPGEYSRVRSRVRDLLFFVAGEQAGKLDVAVGEALNNAARVSMDVQVKFSFFGKTLVVRVKDGATGFDGNERVNKYRNAEIAGAFEEILSSEGGRGIMIMVSWMDKVIYNRKGNEVMLMKRLSRVDSQH